MTGIQHRWDCPVRQRGMAREMAETVVISGTREIRRCLHCHRAAVIDITDQEEQ